MSRETNELNALRRGTIQAVEEVVKPSCQFEDRGFPRTDCFFQAYDGQWHGFWPEDNESSRRHNLGRQYLVEAARERAKEMAVLGIILFASAWPTIAMIVEVVRYYKGRR